LDELCAAGEVVWRGFEGLGTGDGRIAVYLTDHLPHLAPKAEAVEGDLQARIRNLLAERGALFFEDVVKAMGGFRNDIFDALWDLVWAGEVSNDTLAPLRSLRRDRKRESRRNRRGLRAFRSRRIAKTPGSEGRWSLLVAPGATTPTTTERQTAIAKQLIERYGILTREMVTSEGVTGGFAGLYPVLKAMEESGKIRRGYFVAGLGAAQFAAPGADDRLRTIQSSGEETEEEVIVLAATDPANPYGAALRWPQSEEIPSRPQRVAGARVIIRRGALIGYLGRTGQQLLTFLPESEPERSELRQALVRTLADIAAPGRPVYLAKVDGMHPSESELAEALSSAGFTATSRGYLHRGSGPDT
jgi:ATP-dependent Lhr-like helicase